MSDHLLDHDRRQRIGLDEALFCEPKSIGQIKAIISDARSRGTRMLLTRLTSEKATELDGIDYDPNSQTGYLGQALASTGPARVAIATGGTGDLNVALEAQRTLTFDGHESLLLADIGVAGLWRLTSQVDTLAGFPVVIAVAGMDAAMPTVLAGLVPGLVIAVPTSTGYGAARGGETALAACLTSCASGVVVTNIDNGYGAACAATRAITRPHQR